MNDWQAAFLDAVREANFPKLVRAAEQGGIRPLLSTTAMLPEPGDAQYRLAVRIGAHLRQHVLENVRANLLAVTSSEASTWATLLALMTLPEQFEPKIFTFVSQLLRAPGAWTRWGGLRALRLGRRALAEQMVTDLRSMARDPDRGVRETLLRVIARHELGALVDVLKMVARSDADKQVKGVARSILDAWDVVDDSHEE